MDDNKNSITWHTGSAHHQHPLDSILNSDSTHQNNNTDQSHQHHNHHLHHHHNHHHNTSLNSDNAPARDEPRKALLSESPSDDLRRLSLPTTISTGMYLSSETDHHSSGQLSSAPGCPHELAPAAATVAGVGGTITTVTRSKRKTAPLPRLVGKNGQVNLFLDNIDKRQYVRDLFTTMIDIKWRYNLTAAAFGFVFSWLFFACIWYAVLYFHGDLEHEHDAAWSPCIVNVHSFPAALLFSIETQSTLGFGSRIISVECPGAIVIFCIQLIFGVVVECLIVGMVFAKLSRPAKRSQTIMFSKYATICLREGRMCLTFRLGDVRSKSHIIGATLRASLVSSKLTKEGELIPFYYHNLNVTIDDNSKNSLLLIWPVTIVHIIDETSPFYKLNSDELASSKFEIITVLEGTVESTGQSIQVRSSYLPSEVKWGHRFVPIVSTHGYGRYAQTIIDYNKFNRIVEVSTPKCSPMEYYANERALAAEAAAEAREEPPTTTIVK
jgi:potassium inwardly-rectifying channel subfamily J